MRIDPLSFLLGMVIFGGVDALLRIAVLKIDKFLSEHDVFVYPEDQPNNRR